MSTDVCLVRIGCLPRGKCGAFLFLSLFFTAVASWAAHPLVTDDAGTQGNGRMQFEANSEFATDREGEALTREVGAQGVLSVGLAGSLDAVWAFPYRRWMTRESGSTSHEAGLSDASVELKWRFHQAGPFSLAVKPGLTVPTGDSARGLGAGEPRFGLFLIASREAGALGLHTNVGYVHGHNGSRHISERLHGSLAAVMSIGRRLRAVGNAYFENNHEDASKTLLSAVLAGFIVPFTDSFDFDIGVKAAMSRPDTDYALLSGVTWRI